MDIGQAHRIVRPALVWDAAGGVRDDVLAALPDDAHFLTRNFIVNIQQLKFAEPGLYSVDVRLDDESQASIPLLVKLVERPVA